MNRYECNMNLLEKLKEFLGKNKDFRFLQALLALDIVEPGEDQFYEESETTLRRVKSTQKMSVDIKRLMIGDFVMAKNSNFIYKVKDIKYSSGEISIHYSGKEGTVGSALTVKPENIIPIKIEDGILTKLGAVNESPLETGKEYSLDLFDLGEEFHLRINDSISLVGGGKSWHLHVDNQDFDTVGTGDFEYLHELQQLVRIMTGIELEMIGE